MLRRHEPSAVQRLLIARRDVAPAAIVLRRLAPLALYLDLNERDDIPNCGWRCPCWHRWHGLHRLLLLAPSHECADRAYAYNDGRSMQPRIKVDILIEPPKPHPRSDTKPEGRADEIALE